MWKLWNGKMQPGNYISSYRIFNLTALAFRVLDSIPSTYFKIKATTGYAVSPPCTRSRHQSFSLSWNKPISGACSRARSAFGGVISCLPPRLHQHCLWMGDLGRRRPPLHTQLEYCCNRRGRISKVCRKPKEMETGKTREAVLYYSKT